MLADADGDKKGAPGVGNGLGDRNRRKALEVVGCTP